MSSSVTEMWCTIEIIKDRGGSIKLPILHPQSRSQHLRQILPQCNNNKEPGKSLSLSMSWSPANNQTFSWHRAPTTPLLPIFEGPRLTWFPENWLSVLSWSDLHTGGSGFQKDVKTVHHLGKHRTCEAPVCLDLSVWLNGPDPWLWLPPLPRYKDSD